MRKSLFSFLSLAFFVVCSATHLSAQAFSGLSGTVTDSSKSVINGAKVTAKNNATGAERDTTSNSSGFYSFPSLEAGVYTVHVESPGFQSQVIPEVTLKAASSAGIDFTLAVGNTAETVDVQASLTELDTTNSAIGETIGEQQIQELPINGRDYARLSLLTPGAVARSRYISDISFDGLHTVHNQYSIDGVDASRVDQPYMANGYERGSRLLTGSLETIQEFRAQTSGYQAEYGRAAGSLVNIVTKSGSNKYHGEVYDFFRNEALDSSNYFARTTKPRFRYNDFGGNFTGPIWRDHTFFFANYEGSRQTIGIIGSGSVLSNSARAIALAAHPELSPILDNMPTVASDTTDGTVAYTTIADTRVSENTGSIRLDHQFSAADSFFVRANINDSLTYGPLFGVTTTALGVNDHQNVPLRTTNIAIHEQHIFGPRFLNDALIGFQRWASRLDSAEDLPQIAISGVDAAVGSRGNSLSNNNSFQWGDTMTLVRGRHTIKWGATAYRIQLNSKSITNATVSFANVAAFENNVVQQVTQTAGNPGHGTRATQVGAFIQDSWQVRPTFTLNYGLRWDFATNPHDKFFATQSYDPQTGELMRPGGDYFHTNFKNYSPRLGLAWSPFAKTVVRASSGIFFQAYPVGFGSYNVPQNNVSGNLTLTQAANPGLSFPYTTYLASGATPPPTVYGFPTHKPDIYSLQWTLSVAQELGHGTAVQLGYVGNHGVNLWRQENANLYIQNTTTRPHSQFGNIYLQTNTGFSGYNGLQAQLKQRFGKQFNASGNYTFGHVIDDVQDQGLYSSDPQDVNNIRAERGNGSGDIRHNFSFSLVYELPMGAGHSFLGTSPVVVRKLASGWSVNSLGIFRSGVTSNVTMSGINSYGNLNYTNQRPDVVSGTSRYVPRTLNSSGYISYLNRSAWARPADGTFGNSSRNTVYGPKFNQLDLSLLKDTQIHEGHVLQFRAELFNVLNHPNFGFPNVSWTPTSATFGSITSTFGNTLGFGTARQVQFALKYMF